MRAICLVAVCILTASGQRSRSIRVGALASLPQSGVAPPGGIPPGHNQPSPTSGWIRNLLSELSFRVNTTNLSTKALNITDFVCGNITLAPIQSTFHPQDGGVDPSGSVAFSNIEAKCSGNWSSNLPTLPHDKKSGPATASFNLKTLTADVQLTRANDTLINGTECKNCKASGDKLNLNLIGADALDKGLVDVAQLAIDGILALALCPVLKDLIEKDLGGFVNNISTVLRPYMQIPKHYPKVPVEHQLVPLNNSAVKFLGYFLDQWIGFKGANDIVDFFIPDGYLDVSNLTNASLPPIPLGTGGFEQIVGISRLNVSGFNTFQNLTLIQPPTTAANMDILSTKLEIKQLGLDMDFYLEVLNGTSFSPARSWSKRRSIEDGINTSALVQWGNFSGTINNVTIIINTQMSFDQKKWGELYSGQKIDPNCWFTTMEALDVIYLDFENNISDFRISLSGGNVDRDFDEFGNVVLHFVTDSLKPVLPRALRGFFSEKLRGMLNNITAEKIGPNATGCSAPPVSAQPITAFYIISGITVALGTVMLIAALRSSQGIKKRYMMDGNDFDELLNDNDPTALANLVDSKRKQSHSGLLMSGKVSPCMTVSIVFFLFGSIGLFVCGLIATGGENRIEIDINGEPVVQPAPLYFLSLMNSINDSWTAKAYVLSIFLFMSNLIWPFLRWIILFLACFAPVGTRLKKWRYRLVVFADLMGKWTAAQQFVAMLMLTAFWYHVTISDGNSINGGADIFLLLDWWGVWGITAATITGLITSHLVLYVIHKEEQAEADQVIFNASIPALRHTTPLLVQTIVLLLITGAGIGIWYGLTVPAFEFDYRGATELFEELTNTPSSHTYTILSLVQQMPSAAHETPPISVALAQGSVILFAIVTPSIHIVALFLIWVVPLSHRHLQRVTTWVHIICAWSALDVFCVSIVIGFLQIGLFAEFIVGPKCNVLNPLLNIPKVDNLLKGDPKCLDVSAKLLWGTWMLVSAGFIAQFVGQFILIRLRSRTTTAQKMPRKENESTIPLIN